MLGVFEQISTDEKGVLSLLICFLSLRFKHIYSICTMLVCTYSLFSYDIDHCIFFPFFPFGILCCVR